MYVFYVFVFLLRRRRVVTVLHQSASWEFRVADAPPYREDGFNWLKETTRRHALVSALCIGNNGQHGALHAQINSRWGGGGQSQHQEALVSLRRRFPHGDPRCGVWLRRPVAGCWHFVGSPVFLSHRRLSSLLMKSNPLEGNVIWVASNLRRGFHFSEASFKKKNAFVTINTTRDVKN